MVPQLIVIDIPSHYLQLAVNHWLARFRVNGTQLVEDNKAQIIEYQINPAVNERAYLINEDCNTPHEGKIIINIIELLHL